MVSLHTDTLFSILYLIRLLVLVAAFCFCDTSELALSLTFIVFGGVLKSPGATRVAARLHNSQEVVVLVLTKCSAQTVGLCAFANTYSCVVCCQYIQLCCVLLTEVKKSLVLVLQAQHMTAHCKLWILGNILAKCFMYSSMM
jgi:hypothetical protein